MASTPDGLRATTGWWRPTWVCSPSGDAQFYGSTGSLHLEQAHRRHGGHARAATGYWLVASDGGIFNYGDAAYEGSTGGQGITNVVGMSVDGGPTLQANQDLPKLRALKAHEAAHRLRLVSPLPR